MFHGEEKESRSSIKARLESDQNDVREVDSAEESVQELHCTQCAETVLVSSSCCLANVVEALDLPGPKENEWKAVELCSTTFPDLPVSVKLSNHRLSLHLPVLLW